MFPSIETLITFVGASALITVAPGPDNLMVLGHGVSRGREAGIAVALGCALGCATHTLWAALGVSAVIAASDSAFFVLKLLGGGYLLWIGCNALRHAGEMPVREDASLALGESARYLRRGFIANAVNPKVALFFLAFLPQFVDADADFVTSQILVLGSLFAIQTAVIFSAIAYFSAVIGIWLAQHPGAGRWLDRASGTLFIGLGLKLAFSGRP